MRRFDPSSDPYVRAVYLVRDQVPGFSAYPFSIPAIRELHELKLDAQITFLVGDNGSGKSTLIEAIAISAEGQEPPKPAPPRGRRKPGARKT